MRRVSIAPIRCVSTPAKTSGSQSSQKTRPDPSLVEVRESTASNELRAAAAARALSFYTYPADRSEFSVRAHRNMRIDAEWDAIRAKIAGTDVAFRHSRVSCVVATLDLDENGPKMQKVFASDDWIEATFRQEMVASPGSRFVYSTPLTHTMVGVLTEASGRSVLELANEHLFGPLEIAELQWARGPKGYYFGGAELFMRPRDMAKIGKRTKKFQKKHLDGELRRRRATKIKKQREATATRRRPSARTWPGVVDSSAGSV